MTSEQDELLRLRAEVEQLQDRVTRIETTIAEIVSWGDKIEAWLETIPEIASKETGEAVREAMDRQLTTWSAEVQASTEPLMRQLSTVQAALEQVASRKAPADEAESGQGVELRPRLSIRELLDVYDKQRKAYPSLTLAEFARTMGVNYRSLISERSRSQPPKGRGRKRRK